VIPLIRAIPERIRGGYDDALYTSTFTLNSVVHRGGRSVWQAGYRRTSIWVDNVSDGRRAIAKFPKSGVWDKVPERSTVVFADTRIPVQQNEG